MIMITPFTCPPGVKVFLDRINKTVYILYIKAKAKNNRLRQGNFSSGAVQSIVYFVIIKRQRTFHYFLSDCLCFLVGAGKLNKATAVVRWCRKATGLQRGDSRVAYFLLFTRRLL